MRKAIKTVKWERRKDDSGSFEQGFFGAAAGAVWDSAAILLLILSSVSMLTQVSEQMRLGFADAVRLAGVVLFTVFFHEVGLAEAEKRMAGHRGLKRSGKGKELSLKGLGAAVYLLIAALLFFGMYRRHSQELLSGFSAGANWYFTIYNKIFRTGFFMRDGAEEFFSMAACFALLLGFLLLYELYFVLRQRWVFLLFPILFVTLIMAIGFAPAWGQILAAGVGIFMLGRRREQGWFGQEAVTVLLFGGILVLSGLLFSGRAEGLLHFSGKAKEYEDKLEKTVGALFAGVDLSSHKAVVNASPKYQDAKIMKVRLEVEPEGNLYFRDFCGMEYDHGVWADGRKAFRSALRENRLDEDMAGALLATSVYADGESHKTRYQIWYHGFFRRSMPFPYGVDADGIKSIRFRGDTISPRGMTGRKITCEGLASHSFSTVSFSASFLSGDLKDGGAVFSEGSDRWNSEEERLFWEWCDSYVQETCLGIPEEMEESQAFRAQSGMQNPLSFGRYRSVDGKGTENVLRIMAAVNVESFLAANYQYDWELDRLEGQEDPILYFLGEGKKGYCVHFASAGVMLLRKMGVPARYASGYVVKPSAFVQQEDGSYEAEVIDRNGHAWAEVYLDGIGWIPMEMTPGYDSGLKTLPTSKEAQEDREIAKSAAWEDTEVSAPTEEAVVSDGQEDDEEDAEEAEAAPSVSPEDEPEADAGDEEAGTESGPGFSIGSESGGGAGGGGVLAVLALVLFLCLICLGYAAYRRLLRDRLEALLKRQNYGTAVRVMNRRTHQRLRAGRKLSGGRGTDREYEAGLLAVLGEERQEEIAEYMRVVKAAAFSHDRISKQECARVWQIYTEICGSVFWEL